MPQNASISPAAYLRSRVGRVCIALRGSTVEELLERAEAARVDSQFLEFRLDSLDKPIAAVEKIGEFLAEHKDLVAIATCRRKAFGGSFAGSLADELNILAHASEAGFAILDLEIESAEACNGFEIETLRQSDAALLISFHDFDKAVDPEPAFRRIQRFEPDFVKIVSTAHCLTDSLNLLQWIADRSGDAQVVGIAMGEAGMVSRILSLRAGSAFTFASAQDGKR